MVAQDGGRLDVDSTPGRGTTTTSTRGSGSSTAPTTYLAQ